MKFLKKYKWSAMAVGLLVIVGIAAVSGDSYSKYKEEQILDSSLTVASGALAQEITIQEHQAVQNANGSYSLGTSVITGNTYHVVQGVTVPKDPYMTVISKSKVDAYLFLEVVEGADIQGKTGKETGLSYTLNDRWKEVDGAAAKHGGNVYVYANGNSPVTIDEESDLLMIKILKDNNEKVTIGKKVDLTEEEVSLTFYGYLGKAANGSPKEAFNVASTGPNDFMETADAVINQFELNDASIEVKETFDASSGIKSDVNIKNTGSTSSPTAPAVYVRVKLLAYWYEEDSGHIAGQESWTPSFTPGSGWTLKDGYYYYSTPINAGQSTSNLISSITLEKKDGYRQVLEILAEAIQADPIDAVKEAWPGIYK